MNYQQSNSKCVKEAWDVKGIMPEYSIDPDDPDSSTVLIDPVYPMTIHDFATASNNFINFSEDKFISFLENMAFIDRAYAGSEEIRIKTKRCQKVKSKFMTKTQSY